MADRCRLCGAEARFVRDSAAGAGWLMLDAEPSPEGRVLVVNGRGLTLTADGAKTARRNGTHLYRAHASSCPHADVWQRRRATP
jgi:hypothetical protein